MTKAVSTVTQHKPRLIERMAARFGVDPDKMLTTLKATAFKQRKDGEEISNEQMMALLVVADQYRLNPWTKEIYAFPDKQNGIVPVVGVDGWSRIINEHPEFNGMTFHADDELVEGEEHKPCPASITCRIYRKDRAHPIEVTEYFDETYRAPFEGQGRNGPYKVNGPWQTHTKRMLRHKAMIQCSRIAFGFTGFYDPDEAERILEAQVVVERVPEKPLPKLPKVIEHEPEPTLTEKQLGLLLDRCAAAELKTSALAEALGLETIDYLTFARFDEALSMVDTLAKAKAHA